MNELLSAALLCGAAAGFGVFLTLRGALPAGPRLDAALRRLHPPAATLTAAPAGDVGRAGRWLAARVGDRLRPPVRELQLIGRSRDRYIVEKVAYPLFGLLWPPLMTTVLAGLGIRLPLVVPAGAGLICAVLLFLFVDVSLRRQAAQAREEFVRAVAVYLDLVALERSAAHGPVESLERAAREGTGWTFDRIREGLAAARLAGLAPWDALTRVADDIGVPELGDVGDIMRLSGTQGAQVYQTLVSKAQSLRVALRARDQDRANVATTLLYMPTTLTVLVLFALAMYPLLIRLSTA